MLSIMTMTAISGENGISPINSSLKDKSLNLWSLNGIWISDDGGIYYLRQIGTKVWWAGFSTESYGGMDDFNRGLKFTNVFNGEIKNKTIIGKWADVPKGEIMQNGELYLEIITEPEFGQIVGLKKLGPPQPFGGSLWKRYTGITDSPCGNLKTWSTDVVCKFDRVKKSAGDSLLDNLEPFKDNVVLFGWTKSPLTIKGISQYTGRSATDFCNNDDTDGDITFYMQADRKELDSQPNFWTNGWISGNINFILLPNPLSRSDYAKWLLGQTKNYIHPEE